MTEQLDLLNWIDHMPPKVITLQPAMGKTDTSRASAARLVRSELCVAIRLCMLRGLRERGPMTYKEACAFVRQELGVDERTSQPRWTELKVKLKLIVDTGLRRDNCAVLALAPNIN